MVQWFSDIIGCDHSVNHCEWWEYGNRSTQTLTYLVTVIRSSTGCEPEVSRLGPACIALNFAEWKCCVADICLKRRKSEILARWFSCSCYTLASPASSDRDLNPNWTPSVPCHSAESLGTDGWTIWLPGSQECRVATNQLHIAWVPTAPPRVCSATAYWWIHPRDFVLYGSGEINLGEGPPACFVAGSVYRRNADAATCFWGVCLLTW